MVLGCQSGTMNSIHHLSHPDFDPSSYEFIECEDLKWENPPYQMFIGMDPRAFANAMEQLRKERMAHQKWVNEVTDGHGPVCRHCGSHLRYAAIYEKDGKSVVFGQDCSERLHMGGKAKIREWLEDCKRKRVKVRKEAESFLVANPEKKAILDRCKQEPVSSDDWAGPIGEDMVDKYFQWGLSEKQWAFAARLPEIVQKNIDRKAEREAEMANVEPIEEGRYRFEGVVVSTKVHESDWGDTLKATIKNDAGQLIWVTVPDAAHAEHDGEPIKGDRVSLNVTVTRSDRDLHFGFGKRPAKWAKV